MALADRSIAEEGSSHQHVAMEMTPAPYMQPQLYDKTLKINNKNNTNKKYNSTHVTTLYTQLTQRRELGTPPNALKIRGLVRLTHRSLLHSLTVQGHLPKTRTFSPNHFWNPAFHLISSHGQFSCFVTNMTDTGARGNDFHPEAHGSLLSEGLAALPRQVLAGKNIYTDISLRLIQQLSEGFSKARID